MNNTKSPRLAGPILCLFFMPVLTLGFYVWAGSVAKGEHWVVKSRLTGRPKAGKQAIINGVEEVLRVLGPSGVVAVGGAGMGCAVAYLAQVLRRRRAPLGELTVRARELAPIRADAPALVSCPHCACRLTSKEARAANCPVCRLFLR